MSGQEESEVFSKTQRYDFSWDSPFSGGVKREPL